MNRGQKSVGTWVIEGNEFKFQVRSQPGLPMRPSEAVWGLKKPKKGKKLYNKGYFIENIS